MTVFSAAVILSMAVVAIAHLSDRFFVDHVAGAWMALTAHAQDGLFYPALYDGERYGGTRWMPLSVAYTLLFTPAGDPILIGKLASLVAASSIIGVSFAVLRRVGTPWPFATALVAAMVASEPFAIAMWSPFRGDSLAVLLQLLAVALVLFRPDRKGAAAVAGALAASAFLAKTSAGWAPMAIGLFYLLRDRRALGIFVATYAVVLVGGWTIFSAWSDGRVAENVLQLSTTQLRPSAILRSPMKILDLLERHTLPLYLMMPIAIMELGRAIMQDRLTIVHLALGAAGVVAVVIFADPGVLVNHLLDLQVLTTLVVGVLVARIAREASGVAVAAMAGLAAWAALGGFDVTVFTPLRTLSDPAHDRGVTATLVPEGASYVSEDPGVAVLRGEHPRVLDAYMWFQIHLRHPERTQPLIDEVRAGEVDRVIFLNDPHQYVDDPWYAEGHFGSEFVRATLERYRLERHVRGYWVFAPR